jgi:hypothetical protein
MHRWPVIAAIVVWPASVQAAPPSPAVERLLTAIRKVETGGRADGGRNAVGDGGRAIGPYQIWRAYWLDSGVGGRYEDVRDPAVARRVVLAYWARYAPKALATGDLETLARLHNGGPGWSRRPWTTDRYWRRVQQAMR